MEYSFLQLLRQRPLLCDGAMGTLLYARGIPYEQCFDALNLSQPELIGGIHREYINAGAEVVETNSFGANRIRLAHHNLEDKVRQINHRAARLVQEARDITGKPVFIAGAVGPTGLPLQAPDERRLDRKSTRLNSSHTVNSYAVFCLKTTTCRTIMAILVAIRALPDLLRIPRSPRPLTVPSNGGILTPIFFLMIRLPPRSTLFPYTTLYR